MNILFLADRLIMGGLETHIITFSQELLRRGHHLLLYTAYTDPDILTQIGNPNFRFKNTVWGDNPVNDVAAFQPDIIHAHPFTAIVKGYELTQAIRKPFFITMHGLYDFGLDNSPLGNLVSEKVTQIIAVDFAVANILKRSTPHPEKLVVIPNGIDLAFFEPQSFNPGERENLGLKAEWRTITVISRFDDGKDRPITQLIRCLPTWAAALDGVNLVLVGDGSHFKELQQIAAQFEPDSGNFGIYFTGRQNDVRKYIAVSDLCFACDRAAMEAMACRRPVFAMSGAGFAGVIDNFNFKAILLNRSSYRSLEDTQLTAMVLELLHDQSLCRRSADQGLEIIRNHFNITEMADRLERVYWS